MCINCGNDFGKIGREWCTDENGFCICGTCAVKLLEENPNKILYVNGVFNWRKTNEKWTE